MSKTDDFKKMLSEKDFDIKAESLNRQALIINRSMEFNALKLGAVSKIIKDEKLYTSSQLLGDGASWQAYCKMILHRKPETIDKYIKAYEFTENELEIEITPEIDLTGYTINKILLLKNCKNPKEWIEPMKSMPESDLKKEIDEKEFNIKSADDEIEKHIKRAERKKECPFGDFKCGRKV